MPLYKFRCNKCNRAFQSVVDYESRDSITCQACGGSVKLLYGELTTGGEVEVYDVAIPHLNKKTRRGLNDILEDRWYRHKLKHDVAEHVEKHGLNNAEGLGLVKDGRIKNHLDD